MGELILEPGEEAILTFECDSWGPECEDDLRELLMAQVPTSLLFGGNEDGPYFTACLRQLRERMGSYER